MIIRNSYGMEFSSEEERDEWDAYIAKRLAEAEKTPIVSHEEMKRFFSQLRAEARRVSTEMAE
ncbi:MAG: hypothetical protein Q4D61_07495 [Cardiobacteriaceae bacterium]|nr:hypothetical protein [Cardiobacteriaceae bacterium]